MKTIEIENDVYEFLLQHTTRIGESASEILRRLLGIRGQRGGIGSGGAAGSQSPTSVKSNQTEISDCLNDSAFMAQKDVIGKFLFILSYLYKRSPDDFKKVLALSGRRRKYFAGSRQELEDSGSSVFPKQIPKAPYWVVTNNDTPKKKRMLEDVLRILGYSKAAIEEAVSALY